MNHKKITSGLVLLFFQTSFCMLGPFRPKVQPSKIFMKLRAAINYRYNEQFFADSISPDVVDVVISNLDHKSNIQWIRTCRRLYDRYTAVQQGGVRQYNNCLFTQHQFHVDDYTKAMFYYAPKHEEQAKLLLSIGGDIKRGRDEILKGCGIDYTGDYTKSMSEYHLIHAKTLLSIREGTLKDYEIDHVCENRIMSFYKQLLSGHEIYKLASNPGLLQRLLKLGFSPNNYDENRNTVLVVAAQYGRIEALKILLSDSRTDINMQNVCGETAFMKCRNNIEVLILWSDIRIDLNISNKRGETALFRAVCEGCNEKLKILLSDGRTSPNMQNRNGHTPLMETIRCNNIEGLKILLLDLRTDLNIRRENGDTVLTIAMSRGKYEEARMLCSDRRIDLNYPRHLEAIRLLAKLDQESS